MNTTFTFVLALALHLLLGWKWTLLAGVVGGAWAGPGGWRVGAVGVGLDFLVLIVYSYVAAPVEVGNMVETVGGLFGGIGPLLVVVTLVIGVLLGGVGGALGTALRGLFAEARTPAME